MVVDTYGHQGIRGPSSSLEVVEQCGQHPCRGVECDHEQRNPRTALLSTLSYLRLDPYLQNSLSGFESCARNSDRPVSAVGCIRTGQAAYYSAETSHSGIHLAAFDGTLRRVSSKPATRAAIFFSRGSTHGDGRVLSPFCALLCFRNCVPNEAIAAFD